jgi:glycosyltransferase involved in cell wall biosynthesis
MNTSNEVPALSVYMPAYNVAPFVRQAVRSILDQTCKNLELLVVDDGSSDGTLQILDQLAAEDSRMRVIRQEHKGVSAAANLAIQQARAEFVARIDADDVALPDRMEKQLSFMQAHPECVALGSAMMLIDESGMPLYPMPQIKFGHEQIEQSLLHGGWAIAQPACMYRRSTLLAVGGYSTELSLHEDHDLFLRMAEHGKLENLPEVLQYYRQRATSVTARESLKSHHVVMPLILKQARARRNITGDLVENFATPPPPTNLARYRRWAWGSLKAGNIQTARKYARAALAYAPFSPQSWKLLYCSIRGF